MISSFRPLRRPETRWILWPLAGILAVLLFMAGPGYHSPRSLSAAWDLGHVVAFSLWSYLLLAWSPGRKASPPRQWGVVLMFCLVAGGTTEGIQSLLGEDVSLGDLLRDVVGGGITLSWFAPSAKNLSRGARRTVRSLSAFSLLVACLPLVAALCDEGIARARFPLLFDSETPFERSRWEGGARISVDRSIAFHGEASLRVEMDTSLYSGITLVHFPRNWRGYRFLVLEVFTPSPEGLEVTCRIHDRQHEEGEQRYEDRFNKNFHLRPGWNCIRIDLDEVTRAPVGRTMDLGEIREVGLFASRLPVPRTIFVDYVRLE